MKLYRYSSKYIWLFALFSCIVWSNASDAAAQTKSRGRSRHPATVDREFSVPCADALQGGLEYVIKRHDADITRRLEGRESDSDTELLIEKNAFENYLLCRRADTARRLQKLPADERANLDQTAKAARRIAEMRVNLIYGVSFDERYDDPVNYVVSQRAVALVEDYKAELTGVYLATADYGAYRSTEIAERNEKRIGALLKRIEKIALESDQAEEFAAFKTEIEKNLGEIKDQVGNEKRVTTDFLVRLLEMNLPAEN